MKKLLGLATGLNLFAISAIAAEPSDAVRAICAEPDVECLFNTHGVVIARPGVTGVYSQTLQISAARYKEFFGIEALPAAIVMDGVLDQGAKDTVKESYLVLLPWMTLESQEERLRAALKAQFKQQMADMPEEDIEKAVNEALGSSDGSFGGENRKEIHQGVVSHELGHQFFIHSFWPKEADQSEKGGFKADQYGGPAPDWLDEMAAVLMENDALSETR